MSALNLLNQPDTFGNYFQATPTPLPSIPYQNNPVPSILYGVGESGNKKVYRRKKVHQPSRNRPHHPSRKSLNNPIDNLPLDRDKDFIDIGSKVVRKKTIHQFHERPHQIDTGNTVIPEEELMQNANSELTYNDIYKQISSPEHTHDIYKNNIGLEKKRDQISIKSGVPFSSNNPRENIYNNKDKGQNQDEIDYYYDDYYNEEYTESIEPKPSSNRQHVPPKQTSNSANDFIDNSDRKQLLKRYGETDGHPSDWSISHPTTEEELRDMMKYDPYYAQYYYSKYRPQEEGRYAEDNSEDYISKKIRNVRDNNSIFRQDGTDAGSFLQTVMTVASVAMNLFGGGDGGGGALDIIGSLLGGSGSSSGTPTQSKVDRIDTDGVDAAISTINQASGTGATDDLDVAMGTLMAYSGKFLRQIGLWAFEHATQTSSDSLSQSALPDKDTVSAILGGGGGSGGSIVQSSKPYLSTLSQPELEKIGLKAVSAGAKPQELQDAFVTAQTNGDWSKLETLISGALGADAIKNPNANNPISGVTSFVSNFLGGRPTNTKIGTNPVASSSSNEPTYSQVVQNTGGVDATSGILEKLSMVWNGDPNADPITQGNIATRFVTQFGIQEEALALQGTINGVIKTVNSFLGEDSSYATSSGSNSDDYIYVDL